MSRQRKSLCLSLLIHGVLLTSLYAASSSSAWQSSPVVIDFSIASGSGAAGVAGPPPAGPPAPRPSGRPHSSPTVARVVPQPAPRKASLPSPDPAPKTALEQNGPAAIATPPKRESAVVARVESPVGAAVGTPRPSGRGGNGLTGGGGGTGASAGGGGGSTSGSGNGEGGLSAEQLRNRYLKEHFAYIRDLIQKNISYPPRARKFGWAGKVVVTFIVHESGRVSNERVVSSSGYELLDGNVISTIREVSPFPRPPVKAELHIPIVYSLE